MRRWNQLMLEACQKGLFGEIVPYQGGTLYKAGFLYLDGIPDAESLSWLPSRWQNRMFICMTQEWEEALVHAYPTLTCLRRSLMKLPEHWEEERLRVLIKAVPKEYTLKAFDEECYQKQPFSHGRNYPSWEDFRKNGVGAVAEIEGEIVCSASSYISVGTEVELDISTQTAHQRRGLAQACAASMILQCIERGLHPHWDAQNPESRQLAEKLGYALDATYHGYYFAELT